MENFCILANSSYKEMPNFPNHATGMQAEEKYSRTLDKQTIISGHFFIVLLPVTHMQLQAFLVFPCVSKQRHT